MRSRITVIDAPDVARSLTEGDWADVTQSVTGLPGSDVVVLGPGADVPALARRVASRASGAAIVVVDGDVRAAVEASLLPRGRVVGVSAGEVREVAEAVCFDRCSIARVTLVDLGDEVGEHDVILGAGGVREIRA